METGNGNAKVDKQGERGAEGRAGNKRVLMRVDQG